MKKVLLINSPKTDYLSIDSDTDDSIDNSYPIGLLSIAGAIKQEDNHEVDYLDANFYRLNKDSIMSYITNTEPDYIAMNITFPNTDIVRDIGQSVRDLHPDIPMIVGGASATLMPRQVLQTTAFDYLTIGEGEYTVTELLDCLDRDLDISEVTGLAYKDWQDTVIINKPRKMADIETLPYIDVDSIPEELKYLSREIYMVTSRGCDSACTFCSTPEIWGRGRKNLRQYSTDRIFKEIHHFETHGFQFSTVHFLDDNFTSDWNYVTRFMDRWNETYRQTGKTWRCVSRIDSIDRPDRIDALLESGLTQISVGVETTTPRILKKINKRLNIRQVDRFLELCQDRPLRVKGFFMIGFPDETEEEVMDTLRYIESHPFDDVGINIVMAYPNTQMYRQVYGRGSEKIPEFSPTDLTSTSDPDVERLLKKYSSTPSESLTDNISIERLYELKELGYKKFLKSRQARTRRDPVS